MNQWTKSKIAFFPQDRIYDKIESYPPHWKTFYSFLLEITKNQNIAQIYDIGCGSGVYAKFIEIHFPHIKYHGFDIAPLAIEVAIKNYGNYFTLSRWEEVESIQNPQDSIIVANGLIEVVDNPEECLKHILSLGAKFVILQRMLLTHRDTYTTVHNGYDIEINESRINHKVFNDMVLKDYKTLSNPILYEYLRLEDDIYYSDFLLEKRYD